MRPILITTKGYKDFKPINEKLQNNILILNIINNPELFEAIIEVDEAIDTDGIIIKELNEPAINRALHQIFKAGPGKSIYIAFLNSYINPLHENILENVLQTAGYSSIQVSHKIGDPGKSIIEI